MDSGTTSDRQLRSHVTPKQLESVRLLHNGLLDLSETPKHLVEVFYIKSGNMDFFGASGEAITWCRSLVAAQIDAISSIKIPAKTYLPAVGFCIRYFAVTAYFPAVKHIYACGDYPLRRFARSVLSAELDMNSRRFQYVSDAQVYNRYAGWSYDQFLELIQHTVTEAEGKGVEIILDGPPKDLFYFQQD
ncbi:uncharacterized protein N0V89_011390 [Didymosphaeria variabile]|uniref:Uncharacterized protein n=1 Tax=Didymosphaeria variabile TaxID=1932322 RepID=A0A9W8X9N7_9PLEO|nr:uncharacterized protein N0V89_011390 [Didymosphaeria variabile]KAJ4345260.1 hypothetical protein N0V89_011390 [Didymosphaeria variabile]